MCLGSFSVDEGDVALRLVLRQLRRGRIHLLLLHLPQRGEHKHQTQPFIFGVKLAVLNSSGRYGEVERPVTRERCPKNKIIREADGISYLMRANYGESRRAGTGEKGDDSVRTAGRRSGGGTAVRRRCFSFSD